MPAQSTYSFRARDAAGAVISGTMVASNADEVGRRLRTDGKFVLDVQDKPMRADMALDREQILRNEAVKRVRREDVIAFCQQLSVMLETGVPLAEALNAFQRQTARREFRQVLTRLSDDICSGETFSAAMGKWPRVFPSMMVSLMKASEASGTMAMMLGRVGGYLAKERRTAKQIKGALGYPLFMMLSGVLLTVFLMAFVLPRFARIYDARAASLPTPTKILLAISNFLTTEYLIYGPVAIGLLSGLIVFCHTRGGRRIIDWGKLNMPPLRTMFGQLYITRATRTMGTLLAAGVNLLDIIDICRGVVTNSYYGDLWDDMENRVREGQQMSDAIFRAPFIPPNVASMVASGERSGRLPEVMDRIAEFSEEELDAAVKQATSYIEPMMIIIMGIVIGGVALALLLPIFSMGRVMTGG